jgi:hypothetical protein
MDRYIGVDAHASSCTLAVVSGSGKRLRTQVVETNARCLIGAVRQIMKPRHICLEEGTLSEWLYEGLGGPLFALPDGAAALDARVAFDRAALTDTLLRLARLALDLEDVAELDINPLLALPDGAVALDARVALRTE